MTEPISKLMQSLPTKKRLLAMTVRGAGIAIALASLLPLYEVSKAGIDYFKRKHIRQQSIEYASELSGIGHHDRAIAVLETLDNASDYDSAAQFHIALITSRARFFTGGAYQDVEDRIKLLIRIVENDPLPSLFSSDVSDLVSLEILLNDVRIQRQRYEEAIRGVESIRSKYSGGQLLASQNHALQLQEGTARVLSHDEVGEAILAQLLREDSLDQLIAARANHAYGTSKVIRGQLDEGQPYLLSALSSFTELGEDFRSVRTLANLTISLVARRDWESVRFFRLQQESLARRIRDSIGLHNALIGLANVERNKSNYAAALAYAEEAVRAARKTQSSIVAASALQTKANILVRMERYSLALESAKDSIPLYLAENDVRGVRSALGVLGRAANEVGDIESEIYGFFGAIICIDAVLTSENQAQINDREIYNRKLERAIEKIDDKQGMITRIQSRLSPIYAACGSSLNLETVAKIGENVSSSP